METNPKIYLAPLQGFTDFVYRNSYQQVFGLIDEFYIPYISIGPGGKIRNSQKRDILPENNQTTNAVPQVLCSNADELRKLAMILKEYGYQRINLNLGCPYPMATKRGRGTALLENEKELISVLDAIFNEFDFLVSVKFRSGLEKPNAIFNRIEILNNFPFEKMIYHSRIARQLYKGEASLEDFIRLSKVSTKPLIYNGDIESSEDIERIKNELPEQNEWMIGRGVLMNPFLPQQIKGEQIDEETKLDKLKQFHLSVFEGYQKSFSDEGHVLNKLKEFWIYFSFNFQNQRKVLKLIKKKNKLAHYLEMVSVIFST